jgi:hypothetical protein
MRSLDERFAFVLACLPTLPSVHALRISARDCSRDEAPRGCCCWPERRSGEIEMCPHQTPETRGGHPRPPRGSGVRIADGGRRRRRQPWARTCSFPAQAFIRWRAVGSSVGGDDGSDDFCRHSSFTGSLDRWIADLQAFRSVSVLSRPARMHSTTVAHPPCGEPSISRPAVSFVRS